ncbi:hypothetical protein [Micromonospora sp. URMC 103]|uniref:hypothetical protein n=1 Tax=Micromonospora sp. URMC 103 TaxID=3423406 RepID=UPI003F1B6893
MTDEDGRQRTPLVDEVIKKAAVAWVSVAGEPARALWCATLEGALVVVTGPGEQAAPGLADAAEAQVTMRGDHGGRIVTWPAEVSRVRPGTEEWDIVAPLLASKRLNAPGPATELVRRWEDDGCAVSRLTPAGEPVTGDALPDGSLAEAPRDTPAARPTRRPFRLHRVRRR